MSHGFDDFKNMIEMYSKAEADLLLAGKANTASPTFTGTPKAPTPANTVNNTNIATTAFVRNILDVLFPVGCVRVLESVLPGSGAMGYDDVIGHWSYVHTTLTVQGGMSPFEKTYYLYTRTS